MAENNERDAKLAQWLNEAHVKEAELEADLTAHISLTQKASYKKRLQQHLRETRDHKRRVASRIKKLGGEASSPALPGMPGPAGEVAGKAVAAVKGQIGLARAALTEQVETHLRNAQEELREEHVEIAIYTRIETLSDAVGDRETAQLARSIRREEERMAKYLEGELKRLVKEVARREIPRAQRAAPRRRSRSRTAAGGRARSRSASSRSSARSTGSVGKRSRSSTTRSTGSVGKRSRSSATRSSGRSSTSARRGSQRRAAAGRA